MVQIKRLSESFSSLYDPDGNLVGHLTRAIDLDDIRVQIAEQGLEGYYIMFEDIRIDIKPNGDLTMWPAGFYDHTMRLFSKLVKIRRGEK